MPDSADQIQGTELRSFPRVAKDSAETYRNGDSTMTGITDVFVSAVQDEWNVALF
jgi:hypothetical protein